MFGHTGFSESKTPASNGIMFGLALSIKDKVSKTVKSCTSTAKAMTIDIQHDKVMAIDTQYDKVMTIDTQHDIELLGTDREAGYNEEIAYLSPWYRWTFNNTLDDDGYGTSSTPRNGTGHGSIAYTSGGGIIPSMSWESIDLNPDDEVRIADSPKINSGSEYTF